MLYQGIHNLFIVIPQFLSTGLTSLIFAITDRARSIPDEQPIVGLEGNSLNATVATDVIAASVQLFVSDGDENAMRSGNSVAIVFRYATSTTTEPV